ncbi:thioesterase II family protein [Kitasatospora sp. NPDC048286]|uniref:thioesterase II family protein n=1 Tax=Kitasatospora sp. NPDC048286 TaxID=3364047 RepID=UPI0037175193
MNAFVRPRSLEAPAVRLVVFHHAGGSSAPYFPLSRHLPVEWDLLLADLPGRGKRHTAPATDRLPDLVALFADDLKPWADNAPLALFGHSLGAVVALETARELERRGAAPVWVGVCGRTPPEHPLRLPGMRSDLPDDDLLRSLAALGGLPVRIDELPGFRDRFLHLIRTDLRVLESYRPDPARRPLACPLTAFGSPDDPLTPPAALTGWARETIGGFRGRLLPGGHFGFLHDAFRTLASALVDELDPALRPPVPATTVRTAR